MFIVLENSGVTVHHDLLGDLTQETLLAFLGRFGDLLDGIDNAMCFFDDEDRCLYWNRSFLSMFPEHDGHLYKGEPYRENLRRFYAGRLSDAEMPNIGIYIEAGIARHRSQDRPYVFEHHGQKIQVCSKSFGSLGRLRVWRSEHLNLKPRSTNAATSVNLTGNELPAEVRPLLDDIPDGLMICDASGCIVWANRTFADMYRLPNRTIALGNALETVYRSAWSDCRDGNDRSILDAGLRTLQENLRFNGAPFELQLPDDRFVRVITNPRQGQVTIYTHVDITELKRQQALLARAESVARRDGERAYYLATHDALTELPNRMHANMKINDYFQELKRTGAGYAVLMLDIDHFKTINDVYGHAVGDDVLRAVARALRGALRKTDFVARFGGEEFLILLPNTSLPEARMIGDSLISAVRSIKSLSVREVTASAGAAVAEPDHECGDTAVNQADKALYKAKQTGRNRVVSFTP